MSHSDTMELYVQMNERDIYFLETIIDAYDGIGHVRRDWYMANGQRYVKVLVAPDFWGDVHCVIENVSRHVAVGDVRTSLSPS